MDNLQSCIDDENHQTLSQTWINVRYISIVFLVGAIVAQMGGSICKIQHLKHFFKFGKSTDVHRIYGGTESVIKLPQTITPFVTDISEIGTIQLFDYCITTAHFVNLKNRAQIKIYTMRFTPDKIMLFLPHSQVADNRSHFVRSNAQSLLIRCTKILCCIFPWGMRFDSWSVIN